MCTISCIFFQDGRIHNADRLKALDLSDESNWQNDASIWYGRGNIKFIQAGSDDVVVNEFIEHAKSSLKQSATHMQKTLPLCNPVLQGMSALEPTLRTSSAGQKCLRHLCRCLDRFVQEDTDVDEELHMYSVDGSLGNNFGNNQDIIKWWSDIDATGKYPGLTAVAKAALSCFHGPVVESSFSVMTDVLDKKSGNMKLETYSAYQDVKYDLYNQKKTSIEAYKRTDIHFSQVNKSKCFAIRNAAYLHKKSLKNTNIAKKKHQELFDYTPNILSAKKARDRAAILEKTAKRKRDKALARMRRKKEKRENLIREMAERQNDTYSKGNQGKDSHPRPNDRASRKIAAVSKKSKKTEQYTDIRHFFKQL